MANRVDTQIILDGPRNAVVKVEGLLDTSDYAKTTIIDPADFMAMDANGSKPPLGFRIIGIEFAVESPLECRLFWNATSDVHIGIFTGTGEGCYDKFGGLTNNSGAGRTGKILLSTQGWSGGTVLSFYMIIRLTKQETL
jgi:hypothetical protein